MQKDGINLTTNVMGLAAGLPQIFQGVPLLLAGDFVGGSVLLLQGLALFIGFYFVGK